MQITDITPYLPYYLGCEGETVIGNCTLIGIEGNAIIIKNKTHPRKMLMLGSGVFIPHLRPFSDFTVDDLKGWIAKLNELGYGVEHLSTDEDYLGACDYVNNKGLAAFDTEELGEYTPHLIAYLCSCEIDVFGLISAGLAKIKKEEGK